jgi:hypothetical protein
MGLLAVVLCAGCAADIGEPDDPELVDVEAISVNGRYLNGVILNGRYLNGRYLNGVYLNGRYLNGTTLSGLSLQGSQLIGASATGQLTGTQLVGVELTGVLSDRKTIRLLIQGARTLSGANADVWVYGIDFWDGTAWSSACGHDKSGAQVEAIALAGRWDTREGTASGGDYIADSTMFTLGCRGLGAIAKCVEMGYKPWATRSVCSGKTCTSVPLRDHHLACTRMVRADYCGDGLSHTLDGTEINVYDEVGVQADRANWYIDAEWDPDGAACIPVDHAILRTERDPTGACADLYEHAGCGDLSAGGVLVDETKESYFDLGTEPIIRPVPIF